MNSSKDKWLSTLIGDIWLSDEPAGNMGFLTDKLDNRFAGTAGEHSAAEFIKGKFQDYGLKEITSEEFEFQGWIRGDTKLRVNFPIEKELHAIALPYSPPCELEGEVLDLGCGLEKDFERDVQGKIVLVSAETPPGVKRWVHRKEKYDRAVKGRATAFIYMNHIYGNLPQTGSLDDNRIGAIPGISVSREVGERLKRMVKSEESVKITLTITNQIQTAHSHNVVGVIHSPSDKKELIVCGHYDGHDISQAALDNAAGIATLMEIARVLSIYKDKLKTTVRFIGFGAEELGLIGSKIYTDSHDLSNVGVALNLDCAGNGRDLGVNVNGFDTLLEHLDNFSKLIDRPISLESRVFPHSDHWNFVEKGIPGCMIASRGETRGRGWGHTSADTLDKVEIRNIKDNAIVLSMMVLDLAGSNLEFPRKNPEEIKKLMNAEGIIA
ncbi:M28 family peptidase [bacterium]|nr:M28 family peptidase [bacterium]